ncbi:putative ABC transporter domain-containing protein [Desulfonema limicola]|uniref:ABC transporter domain-containing protein n=1 Tax=Desulfonema limicola TaxID=45656 RepID=A0A975B4C1_9BACT|nr:Gldg family protein [Desulfonema limicola]QTA78541.1 putative ABC transporter domain-containing protein [Desulfonema limicola]
MHIKNYAKRVEDFLYEYENYSNGKVKIEKLNPRPDSEEEEWANKYGIEGNNMPMGDKIYFGLAAMAADQEEVIPMLDPTREEQLEYDLTRMISRVQSPDKQKIGIISSLPVFGQPPSGFMQQPQAMQPWLLIDELRKSYEVSQININETSIGDDIDVLLVIHPKEISQGLEYAIDQYVLKGRNLVVFADPFSISDPVQGQQPRSSSLPKLFKAWGVDFDESKVVIDFDYPTRLRTQDNQVEENPMWLSIQNQAFNSNNIITGQLDSVLMPVAGAVKKALDSKYEYEALIQSSANSSMTDAFRARFGGGGQFRRDFKASVDKYDLAVKVSGKFKTAFPEGKPKSDEENDEQDTEKAPDHLTEGKAKSTIIIVSDADMLSDNYYVSQQNFLGFKIARVFNDNLNFLLNSSEMLAGSEALISIRSRGKFERPFTKVQELEKKAQARWLAREQELIRKVDETNQKLRQFEQQKDASQEVIISEQQEEEIKKFQEEKRRINKELKDVRRNLRADIERLGAAIKFVNIFLMVFIVAISGSFYALYRRRKIS